MNVELDVKRSTTEQLTSARPANQPAFREGLFVLVQVLDDKPSLLL